MADENISPAVVAFLRGAGVDTSLSIDHRSPGAPDFDVLQLAMQQRRIVLTHDRDFGTMAIRAGQPYVGIIFC